MSTPSAFPPLHTIKPTSTHTHTIIALHGRGSQGPEFAEELFEGQTFNRKDSPRALTELQMGLPLLPRALLNSLPR